MTDEGSETPVDRCELGKAWQDVQAKYGKEFAPSPQRLAAWHHRGALECERVNTCGSAPCGISII